MAALTYDQLIAQIAARLNRDDLDPDPRGVFVIRDAVVDRIDFYKKECLYTGQVVDTSITMVAGTTHYNNPEGWEELINIQLKQGSVWLDLERNPVTPAELVEWVTDVEACARRHIVVAAA